MTVKIIGKFQEVDGEEFNAIEDLVKTKELIGSTSADVGSVELYYDHDGNTYAVAHDSEEYYGAKENAMNGRQPFVVSTKSLLWTAGLIALTVYVIKNHRDAKKHIRHIRSN